VSGGFDWFPNWTGQTCVVVAGGPSAKDAPLDLVKDRARCVVINEGYRLAPWADALYAADAGWWERKKGCREFRGLRVSQSDQAAKMYRGIRQVNLIRVGQIVRKPKGTIGAGSDNRGTGANSGFQALNLAFQFGVSRLVMVGFDMTVAHGVHWHGRHTGNNPTETGIARWRAVLDRQAAYFAAVGVEIINASPFSALVNYPKMTLEQALDDTIRPARLAAS
jgi:hypothetical protein